VLRAQQELREQLVLKEQRDPQVLKGLRELKER
jgi:hypothetical protein